MAPTLIIYNITIPGFKQQYELLCELQGFRSTTLLWRTKGVVQMWQPAREVTVNLKTTISRLASLLQHHFYICTGEYFYWKKSQEHHLRLFSMDRYFALFSSGLCKDFDLPTGFAVVMFSYCWSGWSKLAGDRQRYETDRQMVRLINC